MAPHTLKRPTLSNRYRLSTTISYIAKFAQLCLVACAIYIILNDRLKQNTTPRILAENKVANNETEGLGTKEVKREEDVAVSEGEKNCCGPGCRGDAKSVDHYDEKYFQWQTRLGQAKAKRVNYTNLLRVQPTDNVLDFGAGGGHILHTLQTSGKKIAVEVNDFARMKMKEMYPEITPFKYAERVDTDDLDLIYSASVLEHVECPIIELRELWKKLKNGGRLAIGIKNEGVQYLRQVPKNDIDNHLYTWNEPLLHNMITAAGFRVETIAPEWNIRKRTSEKWTDESVSSTDAFVYHWAYATKVVKPPKAENPVQ